MDCTFETPGGLFNYRVAAVLLRKGRLLAMREGESYYYLPGGRAKLGETAEAALLREIREELGVEAALLRPLWLCQSFFRGGAADGPVHELCLYYLAELPWERLPSFEDRFLKTDTNGQEHEFRLLTGSEVEKERLYPLFLKDRFPRLPDCLELITEREELGL